ncbi:MAG: hypothetical protein O3B21_16930, partial [Proteobacteria bacterium]|nr:hypothetical protein [Pseudomonadota bacterium]
MRTEEASHYRVKARARAGHSMRGARKGGNIHSLRGKERHKTSQPHARVRPVFVRGVFRPVNFMVQQNRPQTVAGKVQARPEQTDIGQFMNCRHARQSVDAACTGKPMQDGFRLIFAMMRDEQMQHTMPATPLGHEPIAGITRRGL